MILLDTNALLWSADDDRRLGVEARKLLLDPYEQIHVSPVNFFEIETKRRAGRLEAPDDMAELAQRSGYTIQPLDVAEATLAGRLDWDHRDPFDRLLVAQARLNSLTLLTSDGLVLEYEPSALDSRR